MTTVAPRHLCEEDEERLRGKDVGAPTPCPARWTRRSKTDFAMSTADDGMLSPWAPPFPFPRGDSGTSMPTESQGGVHFINAADERRLPTTLRRRSPPISVLGRQERG